MKVTIQINQTPEELTKLIKDIHHISQQQRYRSDETSLSIYEDILNMIVLELPLTEPAKEPEPPKTCNVCGKPSESEVCTACIDKLVDADIEEDNHE